MVPTPSPELETWCERVLRELNQHFPPAVYGLYQPSCNLPHYRALATHLEVRFLDPVLARSAFLHGIRTDELRLLPQGLVDPAVLEILDEREKLRALSARDADVREHLLADVLPNLLSARAIMLFVLDQLHHLDSTGELTSWSRNFHRSPKAPPDGLGIRFKNGPALAEFQGFIDSVVAPTARFFGLQQEFKTLEDASLFYFSRPHFDELLELVLAESQPGGECDRLCRLLADSLADFSALREVCWEWQHLGGLVQAFPLCQDDRKDRQKEPGGTASLSDDKQKGFRRGLGKVGFVTVVCVDEASCYRALYLIHKQLPYRPTEVRDYLVGESRDGYHALHTILAIEDDNTASGAGYVAVRIMPESEHAARYRSAGPAHLDSIGQRLTSSAGFGIRVFAPDGRSVPLPVGATVLEFAAKLNHRWLVHLAGASVNRRPVSLLHRLNPSDVVWLDIANNFLPLPQGWQDRVASKAAARTIAKEFRYFARTFLEDAGRGWLRDRLRVQEGIEQTPDDGDLDSLLDDAARGHLGQRQVPEASSILRSLGVISYQNRGEDVGFKKSFDEDLALRLVKAVALEINKRGSLTVSELDLPEDLRLLIGRVVPCPECKPSLAKPVVGLREGETLILHRPGYDCGADGIPVSARRVTTRQQFFVAEVKDRIGIVAEMLAVFQRQQVNVTEIVGMKSAKTWSVVRIATDRISQKRAQEILGQLKAIPGVKRWAPPDSGEAPDWETPLPPRRHPELDRLALPAPYICGNEINDDNYFYGMINARAELRKIFAETIYPKTRQGKLAFIKGPMRAGKTSLAKFFLRELSRRSNAPCLTAYYDTPRRGTSWSKAEAEIGQVLLRQARNLAERLGARVPTPPAEMPLVELVEHLQERLHCTVVLAIDEIVGLFQESSRAGEAGQIYSLYSQLQCRPRFLLLGIGPASQVRHLPPDLAAVLGHAAPVSVQSLRPDEAKSLLRATNFVPKYSIRFPHRLVQAIHRMTDGNPYWINYLGSRMWSEREGRKDGVTQYTEALLGKAVDQMFQDGSPFAHCLLDSSSVPKVGTRRLLTLLAGPGRQEELRRLPLSGLRRQLSQQGVDIASDELERLLDELQAQGSVISLPGEDGRRSWSVSTPLLRDYIRYSSGDAEFMEASS